MSYPQSNLAKGAGLYTEHIQGGEAVPAYSLVYLDATGRWSLADASLAATMSVVGLATEPLSTGQKGRVLNQGYASLNTWTWTVGDKIYASDTAGVLTQTAGTIVQEVGYAASATMIYFDPQNVSVGAAAGCAILEGATAYVGFDSCKEPFTNYFLCDGVADDVQINAAIVYVIGFGGGSVSLEYGLYSTTAPILIQAAENIILQGSGWNTIIRHATVGTTDSIILVGSRTNVGLVSTGVIIRDLMVDGSNQLTATGDPETTQASLGIDFESPQANPYLTKECIVTRCKVYNTGNDGIYGFYTDNIIVSENLVTNTRSWWAGIHYHADSRYGHWTVVDNIVMNCAKGGIRHGSPIIGNRIYECGNEVAEQRAGIITNAGAVIGNFIQGGYYGIWGYASVETIANNQLHRPESGATRWYGIYIKAQNEVSITGNALWGYTYDGIVLENSHRCTVANNVLYESNRNGIVLTGSTYNTITSNIIRCASVGYPGTNQGILLQSTSTYNTISDNVIWTDHANKPQYCIKEAAAVDNYNNIHDNTVYGYATGPILKSGVNSRVHSNTGHIASGEERAVSGTLTAGNANAIAFAWNNPELQDILINKVVIEVTTAGGTPASMLDVGIADDAAGTNLGVEFFDDLLLNTAQIDDSWVAGDGGTQTKWVTCQDSASATDGWVVGQILAQNAASLVGKYYIEYVGK